MRQRKIKNLEEKLEAYAGLVENDPVSRKGRWRELFRETEIPGKTGKPGIPGERRVFCAEIGCGKGDFICGTAEKNPGTDFIAIERISDVLMLAAEKVKEKGLSNVRLAVMNASDLMNRLPAHSVERIYLNFSDPWPKKGYAKRRLTHRGFLQIYRGILAPGGGIYLKTDDNALFEFSLEELPACGFAVTDVTRDLHESGYASDNVMTEYERNFSAQGKKINMLRAVMKEDGNE